MKTPALYADYGCPYAHRVLAMLHQLGIEADIHLARVPAKPEGLASYSRTGRIPLLVHGDLVLTESRVINEYLAERYDYAASYPESLVERARHRYAIALVDEYLMPAVWEPRQERGMTRLEEGLEVFEAAMTEGEHPSLFAIHIAPIWLRLSWELDSPVAEAVCRRPALRRWLDTMAQLRCVQETSPNRALIDEDLERARADGLLEPRLGVNLTV